MADAHPTQRRAISLFEPTRSEDDLDLQVVGRIPDALAGAYYRNGPNPQFDPQGPYFPFAGDGMIHAFFLEPNKDGGRARYRNRWVRTPKWHAENKAGRLLFNGFGPSRDPAAAGVNPAAANIHIVCHGGKLMALSEHGEPFELDPEALDRGAFMSTGGKRHAHPKIDPETGEMVWLAYFAGAEPFNNLIDYGVTDKSGKVTRCDRFAAPYAAMMHDFMVTRNYVMFPLAPLTADPARALKGSPLAWEPAKGGFVGVMKRNADVDSIRWFEIEPGFFLHTMNAWEDGEKIHCEVTEFPHPPGVFPNADGTPSPPAEARLKRWTIDLGGNTNRATREQVDDLNSEMPRFDERFAGLPYRHGWYMADIDSKYPLMHDAIAHLDFRTGKRAVRTLEPGDAAGEPVFVPRSAVAPEGDGYIISLVYRAASNASELLILNAQDIAGEPAAIVKVPRCVTVGLHGNFVAA